jgi:signal peptidase I
MSEKNDGQKTPDGQSQGSPRGLGEQRDQGGKAGQGGVKKLWEQASTLLLAVAIALSIRAFVIEPFRIPSGSMLPTLLIGDHLFVNKFVYGIKIPFTDLRLPGLRKPRRGDVVVFSVARDGSERIIPADRRPDLPRDDFVKRIVGLPGDRVEVRGGRVYVNDQRIDLLETGEVFPGERGGRLLVMQERLDGCPHAVLDDPHQLGLQRAPFTIQEGRYFMLGDNRDHSNDSRSWGTVRLEELKGPAFVLYWSWDVNGSFLQFLNPINWITAEKRWGRIFRRVRCDEPASGG